ncbi:MAG: hypothetical protein HY727_00715 [Candidatus Rokubacteria bacterium]|nr:hypothetical protein [Candidatus Rokubacteria bacterium]
MTDGRTDLRERLAALTERVSGLATRLAEAAEGARQAGAIPPEALAHEIVAIRRDFDDLRARALEAAAALSLRPGAPPEALAGVGDLLRAIVEAERRKARQGALVEARDRALAVLDRVAALAHRQTNPFAPLVESQARARELRLTLASAPSGDVDEAIRAFAETTRPFVELLGVAEAHDVVDDERWALLHDSLVQVFPRPLVVAALRGQIGIGGQPARPAPPAAPVTAERPPVELRQAAPAPPRPVEKARPAPPKPAIDRRELERTAQWWLRASAAWRRLRDQGVSFADAAREELRKYPHLLSVPIQETTEHDGGRLAEGYALLLDHLERQEPGFVEAALDRLNPDLVRGASAEGSSLGRQLYDYAVAEGRLYRTYIDFVREVVASAIPDPGCWIEAGIAESEAETSVLTRPTARVGDTEQAWRRLTDDKARFTQHRFSTTVAPLTARVFSVDAVGDLEVTRDAEVKLTENDAPADRAWLVVFPGAGGEQAAALRRLRPAGIVVPELGKEYRGLRIAVFNPDPYTTKRYELILGLSRKPVPTAFARLAKSGSPRKKR